MASARDTELHGGAYGTDHRRAHLRLPGGQFVGRCTNRGIRDYAGLRGFTHYSVSLVLRVVGAGTDPPIA